MGWGERHRPHIDADPYVVVAAKNLAERVRAWDQDRTTANEQRMVVALAEYDMAVERAGRLEETGRRSGW